MADDAHLLTDIRLDRLHRELRPVYGVGTERRVVRTIGGSQALVDLAVSDGRDNLGQAVVTRLLTPRGELAGLGHPQHGSRIHELIGEPNTETTRNRLRLFVLEALAAEPRIERVLEVTVEPVSYARDLVTILIRVQPVRDDAALTIGPLALELGT